jgi:hypothetical protein
MLRRETHSVLWYGNLKERDHLEDLYPDGRLCYVTSVYTVYVTFDKIYWIILLFTLGNIKERTLKLIFYEGVSENFSSTFPTKIL